MQNANVIKNWNLRNVENGNQNQLCVSEIFCLADVCLHLGQAYFVQLL